MRLDLFLKHNSYTESREKAAEIIKDGKVLVNGQVIQKPAFKVKKDNQVTLIDKKIYVARSAHKLLSVFEKYDLNLENLIALDLGSSTGGFVQVLLEKGVRKVYAVDVGTNQLHDELKANPKVISLEKTDARTLNSRLIPDKIDIVTADLSFISIFKVLPYITKLLKKNSVAILLFKPQFELSPKHIAKDGLIKDDSETEKLLKEIPKKFKDISFEVKDIIKSPIKGTKGNQEYLIYAVFDDDIYNK